MTETHTWHISNHARPTFCNVCRDALSGVTLHGLSCGVCKLKAHKACVANVLTVCKWTTIHTVEPAAITHENEMRFIQHQWIEGNLSMSAKCVVCDKTCGSVLRLQDFRCLWCRATVHTTCRSSYVTQCSLGPTRHATVPPTRLAIDHAGKMRLETPVPGAPLIVFVNSKSGDGHGDRFLRRFRQILNPAQVFDLANGGPRFGLEIYRCLAPLRLLICGGDGSIGWVLKEIDQLQLKAESVCVSVLPLGTGNDLARVCGWGSAIEDDVNLINLLEKYDVGSPRLLDRWSIFSVKSQTSTSGSSELCEAPSVSEDLGAMGQQVGALRARLDAFLEERKDDGEALHKEFFVLQKLLSDVLGSTDEAAELFLVAQETSALLDNIAASATRDKDQGACALPEPTAVASTTMSMSKCDKDVANVCTKLKDSAAPTISFDNSVLTDLRTLSCKLLALETLLLEPSSFLAEARLCDVEEKEDPVILITAPSIDEADPDETGNDNDNVRIPFPGSQGKLFQTSSLPSPLESLCLGLSTADVAVAKVKTDDLVFAPSPTTNFPFPPSARTIPVCLASVSVTGALVNPPLPELRLAPTPPRRRTPSPTDKRRDDDNLSVSSVSLESVSSQDDAAMPMASAVMSLLPPVTSADLLALSPLPSPHSRHGSIFTAASDLPVPCEFSDADADKAAESLAGAMASATLPLNMNVRPSASIDEEDELEAKAVLSTCAGVASTTTCVSSASGSGLLSPQTSESAASALTPMRSRSRLSTRLSSVPEDESVARRNAAYSDKSVDIEPEDSIASVEFDPPDRELLTVRRTSGSRRLSVGAMVSLSTLRSESGSRLSNKTIPIINPLVKNPNWPNLERGSSRGLISMVVLASADALCAPVTPIMDWTPPPDRMDEISVMNNYFGIGIDAKISLDFHNKREESSKQRSRAKNYMWYGVLGSRELVQKTYKNLEKRVILECDGEAIPLPSLQGIVVLNIQSFMGGTNFWGSAKDDNIFLPPGFDDGILEVVAVFGSIHMGASRIMNLQRHRIAQCRSVVIRILGNEGVPVQVDGEAWVHPPGIIRIMHKNRVQLICRDRSMEQQMRSGCNSRAWYREHAHAVLLPLDEEETHLLRSLVGAARQMLHYLLLLHHALDGQEGRDLASLALTLQESMSTIPPDNILNMPAAESRRRMALFVNHLRNCIASCKKTLVENVQEAQSDVAGKLSQSIYWVENVLSKCHEEGELLFFTIRQEQPPEGGRRSSWFRSLPLFGRSSATPAAPAFGGAQLGALGALGGAAGFVSGGAGHVAAAAGPGQAGAGHAHVGGVAVGGAAVSSGCLVEVVLQWTPHDVSRWLESIGMPMYCHAFLEHEISGTELLSLERRDFKDVGVSKVGHIKRLQRGIKEIQQGKLPPRLLQSSCVVPSAAAVAPSTQASSLYCPVTVTAMATATGPVTTARTFHTTVTAFPPPSAAAVAAAATSVVASAGAEDAQAGAQAQSPASARPI